MYFYEQKSSQGSGISKEREQQHRISSYVAISDLLCVCVSRRHECDKRLYRCFKRKKKEIQLLFSIFILSTVRWSDMFYSVSGREVTNAVSEWMDGMTFLKGIQIP